MNIPCNFECSSITDIQDLNSSFAKGKIKVMYLGSNQNNSHFTKEAVEKALPSLANVPVVCNWNKETEEIGGHDVELATDSDGKLVLRTLTDPCGVVPKDATFSFQEENIDENTVREYLIADDVILWKRQPVYQHIAKENKVSHSMEIAIHKATKDPDGILHIEEFEFTALCLLGNCEPCFEGSCLELYSLQSFGNQMSQMMKEFKTYLSEFELHTTNQTEIPKGGNKTLNNQTTSTIPVDASFALESRVESELRRLVRAEKVETHWGLEPKRWFVDYDKDKSEVYYTNRDDSLLCGSPFSISGDEITIDFSQVTAKKWAIVDLEDGDKQVEIFTTKELLEVADSLSAELSSSKEAFSSLELENANLKADLELLKQYKANIEISEKKGEFEAMFAKFADLSGVAEFEALVTEISNDALSFSVSEIEEKCYAIRGKNVPTATVPATQEFSKSPKLKVVGAEAIKEPYGGLFTKYGQTKE